MKKKYIVLFIVIFLSFIYKVDASVKGVVSVNDSLNVRSGPNSSSSVLDGLYNGTEVDILDLNAATNADCPGSSWYKIQYGKLVGYSCGLYINIKNTDTATNRDDSYSRGNYNSSTSKDGTVKCYEDTGDITLKTSPTGGYTSTKLSCGQEVNILDIVEKPKELCPYWYKVSTNNGSGYTCGYYINTTKLSTTAINYYKSNSNGDTQENYKAKLISKGFPESYLTYLLELHARHPRWDFISEKINLNFDDVVEGEAIDSRSLLDRRGGAFDLGYISTASFSYNVLADKFIESSEAGHYNASKEAIAYFLDPRNYLTERYIFAFETLAFSETQNTSVVSTILSGQNFWTTLYKTGGSVSSDIVNASREVGISASHVASRIKQEIGTGMTTSDSRLGGKFTYNGNSYSNYYNFFNIKSSCSNCSSIYAGYAYEKGWNTPYKGIKGGAQFMYNGYISENQDTIYYEKFDVSRSSGKYVHQYMQNLAAPVAEGGSKYKGYLGSSASYLDSAITFVIPVYNNMPTYAVTAPKLGNPNNYLKNLTIDGKTIANFSYDTYNYNVYLNSSVTSVNIGATTINANAKTSNTGTIKINSNNQTNSIIVTAQNGKTRKYNITFIRQASPSTTVSDAMNNSGFKYNDKYLFGIEVGTNVSSLIGNITRYNNSVTVIVKSSSGATKTNDSFRTGDKVTITGKDGSKTYTAIIYGDINGDGLIDKNDLLYVQSKVFGYSNFDSIKSVAADINRDGKVDKNDLLYVQSHVFGYSKISQK